MTICDLPTPNDFGLPALTLATAHRPSAQPSTPIPTSTSLLARNVRDGGPESKVGGGRGALTFAARYRIAAAGARGNEARAAAPGRAGRALSGLQ